MKLCQLTFFSRGKFATYNRLWPLINQQWNRADSASNGFIYCCHKRRLIIVISLRTVQYFLITPKRGLKTRWTYRSLARRFDLKAAFMRHSIKQQCSKEAFSVALAGCVLHCEHWHAFKTRREDEGMPENHRVGAKETKRAKERGRNEINANDSWNMILRSLDSARMITQIIVANKQFILNNLSRCTSHAISIILSLFSSSLLCYC